MSGLNIIKGSHPTGVDVTLLARVRLADNSVLVTADQPDVTNNAFSIATWDMSSNTPRTALTYVDSGDKDDAGNPVVGTTGTPLIVDGFWDVEATTGYNIRLVVPYNSTTGATGIDWEPTHTYRIVATVETDGNNGADVGVVKIVWEIAIDVVEP